MFFILGFIMKFPVYFLHFWLPKAHVESPTTGSMLLAGLLLKFGTIGFIRFIGSIIFINIYYLVWLSVLGILVCCLVCLIQRDCKSLVAYSSIVHISFLLLNLILYSSFSKNRSLLIILSHGYVSVILFYLVGEFFHSGMSRMFYFFNRFLCSSIFFCWLLSFFILLNCGLPLRLNFLSEFLGILNFYNIIIYGFFVIFLYFFLSFYYCIFILLNSFLGKAFIKLRDLCILNVIPFLTILFNIFWYYFISYIL